MQFGTYVQVRWLGYAAVVVAGADRKRMVAVWSRKAADGTAPAGASSLQYSLDLAADGGEIDQSCCTNRSM